MVFRPKHKVDVIDVTPGLPKWTKGLARLTIVVYIVLWIACSLYFWNYTLEQGKIYQTQLRPDASMILATSDQSWCVIMATKKFLALSDTDKVDSANAFFDRHIKGGIESLHYDVDAYRESFVRSATLSLKQAPIRTWQAYDGAPIFEYRYLPYGDPFDTHPFLIHKLFFNQWSLLLPLGAIITLYIPCFLIFFGVMWIVRGFLYR